jgi:Chaperone of endosialidase/YadA head domain repeat (2 copies)
MLSFFFKNYKLIIMRRIRFLFVAFLCVLTMNGYAQIPEQFNYQAVLRDSGGELLVGQAVEVEITIINNNAGGAVLYTETHNKTTNAYGLVNLLIGTGSGTDDFSVIDWAADKRFIGVKVDAGSGLTDLGAFQLLSVPYALYANSASNLGSDNIYIPKSDTLFAVKDHSGNVVFAVFPDGVKVIVEEATKGTVGGFAVSGRSPTKAGETTDIFRVTPDSTRIYVNDTLQSKGRVGGFAVSGRSPTKGINQDYLVVTQDSTRVYVNDSISTKGRVGGFAVSGRSPTKGSLNNYMEVTKDSTRIYITEGGSKGRVGGFAVSGRSPTKATPKEYFNISGSASAQKIINESRVMWYPEKSALLAGELNIPNADSVGEFSLSLGYHNIAKGKWSQAMGSESVARGDYSTAVGYQVVAESNSFAFGKKTKAIGFNSFAFGTVAIDSLGVEIGVGTIASGDYSFAFGLGSTASATGAFVLGTQCTATGNFSASLGYLSDATGWGSTAMGSRNLASGDFSIAIGLNNDATQDASVAFGVNNISQGIFSVTAGNGNVASGSSSVAIGTGNIASGNESFTGGRYNNCSDEGSTAFGTLNTSSGGNSFAIGYSTQATKNGAFSSGYLSQATGINSFAIGESTSAANTGAFAAGFGTTASGLYSMAFGFNTSATPYASLVIGQYNEDNADWFTDIWNPAEPLIIAGNGWDGAPSDAMILYKNGNLWIAGDYDSPSDIRLKENIVNMENILPKVLKINSVYYEFKNQKVHPAGRHIGFIAQEIEPLFPELVSKDSQGFLSLKYSNMTVVLLQAIKEQQNTIEAQNEKQKGLEDEVKLLNEKLDKILKQLENK